ncbi:hypothetical protein LR48_Vigan197s001300 [Vigna angularis]|uniref:Putative plant transposon protein domain-containing protein n=1 Tax=Phaseolus angularis TaxID=3914 RepID=A0A0L9T6W1_PHAAN|nr:hypothetical protein LR48_Vigan197s001300 [Vigna angularis]
MERKTGLILDFAPQFGKQLENRNWERLASYPTPANIAVVKEFYTNARQLGDYPTEEYMSYVRGHTIRYDPDAINRFFNTEWAGEQCQFALSMEEGANFVDRKEVEEANEEAEIVEELRTLGLEICSVETLGMEVGNPRQV